MANTIVRGAARGRRRWLPQRRGLPALALVLLVVAGMGVASPQVARERMSIARDRLVFDVDLRYEGAFRVPGGLKSGGQANAGFDYGGTALAFDPTRRTLFLAGHDWDQFIAEISVPAPAPAGSDRLPEALLLQGLVDPLEGRRGTINPTDPNSKKIGGLLPFGDHLIVSAYSFYDAEASQIRSHFVRPIDLATTGAVRGPLRVGSGPAGMISGYFGQIPEAWQTTLGGAVLNGNCCLSIISRTSFGPAAFAMDPRQLVEKGDAQARALVFYPQAHPTLGKWESTNAYFNGSTAVRAVVFPPRTRSVLFFGRHGLGPFCYGPGTDERALVGKPAPDSIDRYCFDPSDASKGVHGYPYSPYVWAYDAADLARVASGRTRPWDVRPYAVWSLALPRGKESGPIGGAAYDSDNGRLFVSEMLGEGTLPLIHVFTLR